MLLFVTNQKKVTLKAVQKLTGLLNFLLRVIVPGRMLTRHIYNKLKITDKNGDLLKQYHHIWVDQNFRLDCEMWLKFLTTQGAHKIKLCRPFVDMSMSLNAKMLDFYSDASLNKKIWFWLCFWRQMDFWSLGRRFC